MRKKVATRNMSTVAFNQKQSSLSNSLRWPVPIYMRVGYVFDSHFSE